MFPSEYPQISPRLRQLLQVHHDWGIERPPIGKPHRPTGGFQPRKLCMRMTSPGIEDDRSIKHTDCDSVVI